MKRVRKGESAVFRRRKARFYNQGREWFFRTREEAPIGPFTKLSEAVVWAQDYASCVQTAPLLEDVVQLRDIGSNRSQVRAS